MKKLFIEMFFIETLNRLSIRESIEKLFMKNLLIEKLWRGARSATFNSQVSSRQLWIASFE